MKRPKQLLGLQVMAAALGAVGFLGILVKLVMMALGYEVKW